MKFFCNVSLFNPVILLYYYQFTHSVTLLLIIIIVDVVVVVVAVVGIIIINGHINFFALPLSHHKSLYFFSTRIILIIT